jgi:hypothetical protein
LFVKWTACLSLCQHVELVLFRFVCARCLCGARVRYYLTHG